jgi:hypothetical protein
MLDTCLNLALVVIYGLLAWQLIFCWVGVETLGEKRHDFPGDRGVGMAAYFVAASGSRSAVSVLGWRWTLLGWGLLFCLFALAGGSEIREKGLIIGFIPFRWEEIRVWRWVKQEEGPFGDREPGTF